MRPLTQCKTCHEHRENHGRGLCQQCYFQHRKAGTLELFPLAGPRSCGVPQIPGVSYRQLDHWVRRGYLRPEHKGGSGVFRRWSDDELRVLERMARLVQGGVLPAQAVRIARGEAELVTL